MNESVELMTGPELMRNSLIFTALAFRTFSTAVSDCFLPLVSLHVAWPTKSPLKAIRPEVTLKFALTLAPGTTAPVNFLEVSVVPETTDVHCLGTEMLSWTLVAEIGR